MSAAEQTLSFDDILEAVKESRRGRWFLDEFENRLRKADTASLLSAIAKLESVMAGMGGKGAEADLLARAKAAILAARKDIAAIDGASHLSAEARLFSKLAEMARKSFAENTPEPVVNTGVIRALRLVDELEADICGPAAAPAKPARYFQQDADVFETPKPAAAAPVAAKPAPVERKPEPEAQARGAKLVIHRAAAKSETTAVAETPKLESPAVGAPDPAPAISAAEEPVAEQPVAAKPVADAPALVSSTSVKPDTAPHPRVVIIRRKPEEMMEMPLVAQDEASAA